MQLGEVLEMLGDKGQCVKNMCPSWVCCLSGSSVGLTSLVNLPDGSCRYLDGI